MLFELEEEKRSTEVESDEKILLQNKLLLRVEETKENGRKRILCVL